MLPRSASSSYSSPPAPAACSHASAANRGGLFAQGSLDIDVLSELLGSLDSAAATATATADPSAQSLTLPHYPEADADLPNDMLDVEGDVDIDAEPYCGDMPDYSGITTESVLFGLRSLDHFERQAAIHTEGRLPEGEGYEDEEDDAEETAYVRESAMETDDAASYECLSRLDLLQDLSEHTPSAVASLGSFNEAELSAALEQIYWGSLEIPLPVSSSANPTMAAPTPASTPVSYAMPADAFQPSCSSSSSWAPANAVYSDAYDQAQGAGAYDRVVGSSGDEDNDDDDDDDEEDDDEENPLELEELSLFSLFISDMPAFEAFLGNLSLNQLRLCAATVNSVLVRRETTLSDTARSAQPNVSRRQQPAFRSSHSLGPLPTSNGDDAFFMSVDDASEPGWPAQLKGHLDPGLLERELAVAEPEPEQPGACLPSTTLTLLREWLPPSTADCVITALQAANLASPLAPNAELRSAAGSGAGSGGGGARGEARLAASSLKPQALLAPIPSTGAQTNPVLSESRRFDGSASDSRQASSHYYGESIQTNEPLLETGGDDVPWLSFVYAQKGKPRRHRIRIDIERAPLPAIPSSFQANNCVYPRANCAKPAYTGNRWAYETECNGIGWKLAFLNQELLSGRRGLLQTAVNNYRTIVAGRKSRRIARLEKAERSHQAAPGCESRPASAGRLALGAGAGAGSSSSNKRPLPPPASASSADQGELCAGTGAGAEAEATAPPGDKRAKFTHCQPDNASSPRRSLGPASQLSLAQATAAGSDVLLMVNIGDDGGAGSHQFSQAGEGAIGLESLAASSDTAILPSADADADADACDQAGPLSTRASTPHAAPARASGLPQPASAAASQHAKCLTVNAYVNSKFSRIRICIDLGTVDSPAADARFKKDHAVFPRALSTSRSRYGALQGRWEFELACNELAWKLAWLNKGRLRGRRPLIQKCLDAYRARFSTPPWALLACYRDQMGESVDARFFDYWAPRPGRRGLGAGPAAEIQPSPTDEHVPAASGPLGVASQHSSAAAPSLHSVQPSSRSKGLAGAAPANAPPLPAAMPEPTTPRRKASDRPLAATAADATEGRPRQAGQQQPSEPHGATGALSDPVQRSPSSSGSDSAARMRIVRPKSGSANAAAAAAAAAAVASQPGQSVPATAKTPIASVVSAPASAPPLPAAHAAGPTRPVPERPAAGPAVPALAPGPQARLDPRPLAVSRPALSTGAAPVGSAPPRPRPPPAAHLQLAAPRRPATQASPGQRPPPPPQLPAPISHSVSLSGQGARPASSLGNGQQSVPQPATGQHSRPGPRPPPAPLAAASSRPALAKVVPGASSSLPSRASASVQQQRPPAPAALAVPAAPAAPGGDLLPRSSTTASLPVTRRRHTDTLNGPTPGRPSTPRPLVPSSHTPAAVERARAEAASNRPSPSSRTQTAAKPRAQASKASLAASPAACSNGSEKSVKAQVAADMLTDVLRRLARTDPSLAPLAGVLSKSHPSAKAKAWPSPRGSVDDDDEDAPLDAKVAELEKLIIDLQNN